MRLLQVMQRFGKAFLQQPGIAPVGENFPRIGARCKPAGIGRFRSLPVALEVMSDTKRAPGAPQRAIGFRRRRQMAQRVIDADYPDRGDPRALMSASTLPNVRDEKPERSEEHTSELQSLLRNSYAVFCLKKPKTN